MLEEFKNAFQRGSNAHIQLIIINVAIFVVMEVVRVFLMFGHADAILATIYNQFTIPPVFSDFLSRPWTIITYAFAHDLNSILHILFNMLVLYWFGRLFVEYLGSDKLVALYIIGGIAGAVFYLLAYNTVPFFIERNQFSGMVGASAAINAIVVASATLLPNYTFYLLFLGPVRIKYIAAVTVFLSFIGTVGSNGGGNIAHLGGALIGFIYLKQLQAGINWGSWVTSLLDWTKDIFRPKPRVKVTYRKTEASAPRAKAQKKQRTSQEEIDAILDKISERGYESLTREEKEKLFNASKK